MTSFSLIDLLQKLESKSVWFSKNANERRFELMVLYAKWPYHTLFRWLQPEQRKQEHYVFQ